MAQPLIRATDFPNLDTPETVLLSRTPLPPTPTRVEELLTDTAESIGGAMGSAVRRVTELQQLLEKQFAAIQERSQRAAAEKVAELKEAADAKISELKDAADQQIQRARAQAEYVTREYPLQVIAGVAAVAFLAGVSLRIWRANRA